MKGNLLKLLCGMLLVALLFTACTSKAAKAVEKVVAQNGCKTGVWSGHGMGHDLGDGVDIGNMNEMEIVPNMVLTLHPSVLSDKDGFLFGNTWLATPDGAELLSPQYYNTHELEELKELVHYK